MKKAVSAILVCVLVLLFALPVGADTINLKGYSKILAYIKENQPLDLDIGDVRIKPTELFSLLEAMPEGGKLHFSTAWGGIKFSDTSEFVDLRKITTGVSAESLEAIVQICPNVKKIDNTGKHTLSNEFMIALTEKYPDIEFGWLIHLGGGHYCPSTATAYSTLKIPGKGYDIKSSDLSALKYAKSLRALDLGHHQITDLSFLADFPDLELLILACNKVADITEIGNLKKLQYLEIFLNSAVTDLTPLASCTELIDLNISGTAVTDLSPLDGLTKLDRFWANVCKQLPDEEKARFCELHPNCTTDFKGSHSTPNGWRQNHPRYKHYLWCFRNKTWIPFDQELPKK